MPTKRKRPEQLTLMDMKRYAEMEIGQPIKSQGCELRELDGKVVQIFFYRYNQKMPSLPSMDVYRWKIFIDGKSSAGGIV